MAADFAGGPENRRRSMKLAIPKERLDGETRVAASPETVKKLVGLGLDVIVETGAGAHAAIADQLYSDMGATIASGEAEALKDADIVFKVRAPSDEEIGMMKRGAMLAAILNPWDDKPRLQKYADAGVNAFAMEFMPRITRAQSMDVLSSQSNLAGAKAVINAAAAFTRAMPMTMTAAGTIAPARVFIMGVGVAGLQAIATASASAPSCPRPTYAPPRRSRSKASAAPSSWSNRKKAVTRPAAMRRK